MREVIERTAQRAEELVEAVARGVKLGLPAEVPLADQRGRIARRAQLRRYRGVAGRNADFGRLTAQRLFEQALERVASLRSAGVKAWRRNLRDLGLTTPKGDLADYLNGGGEAARLRPRRVARRSA